MTPIAQNPQFAEALEKHTALAMALGKLHTGIAEIEARLRAYQPNAREDQVAAALAYAQDGRVRAPEGIDDLQQQHVALRQQVEAVQRAMQVSSNSMDHLRGEISCQVCRSLDSEHATRIGEPLRKALAEAYRLVQEERLFIQEIESAGYSAVHLRHNYRMPHIEDVLKQFAK